MRTTSPVQHEFLRQTAIFNAIGAAFPHAGIYREDATDREKMRLRAAIEAQLRSLESAYRQHVSSHVHTRNIEALASRVTDDHARILRGQQFRIGPAQKALNIYLKLLWCYGWIPEPPHCPLDSIVLAEVGDTTTKWTRIASIQIYRKIIATIRRHVRRYGDGKSLSHWELETWNRRPQSRP